MTKNIFEMVCEECGNIFRNDNTFNFVCCECRKKRRKYKKRKNILKDLTINEVIMLMEEYNREYKMMYSYGQFVALLNSRKIKIDKKR